MAGQAARARVRDRAYTCYDADSPHTVAVVDSVEEHQEQGSVRRKMTEPGGRLLVGHVRCRPIKHGKNETFFIFKIRIFQFCFLTF